MVELLGMLVLVQSVGLGRLTEEAKEGEGGKAEET